MSGRLRSPPVYCGYYDMFVVVEVYFSVSHL